MFVCTTLEALITTLTYGGYALSLWSIFLYGSGATLPVTPLHACIPVVAALISCALGYCAPLTLIILSSILLLGMRTSYRRYLLHALLCMWCSAGNLILHTMRHQSYADTYTGKPCAVTGMVREHYYKNAAYPHVMVIDASTINKRAVAGVIKIHSKEAPECAIGAQVTLRHLILICAHAPQHKASALRDGCIGSVFCKRVFARQSQPMSWYGRWCAFMHTWRAQLYQQMQNTLDAITDAHISALFWGNKTPSEYPNIRMHYVKWGLAHYLARSGLHISLLMGIWSTILRFVPLPQWCRALFLTGALSVYSLLSWPSISFNRAQLLWFLYLGGWILQKTATPLWGLAHIALCIVLTNPWQAGCLDFQLSFFLTFILMLYGYQKRTG